MKVILMVAVMLLVGCSAAKTAEEIKAGREHGELRHTLFVECMELSAKNGRASDDDVSDVVDSCNSHSLYLANSMRP